MLTYDQFIKATLIDCDLAVSTDEMFRVVRLVMRSLQNHS